MFEADDPHYHSIDSSGFELAMCGSGSIPQDYKAVLWNFMKILKNSFLCT